MPCTTPLRRVLAIAVALLCALLSGLGSLPATAATRGARTDGTVASATATSATIGNGRLRRTWKVVNGAVVTSGLVDVATGRQWSTSSSPDFRITVDGIPTTSTDGWVLRSITPARTRNGAQLLFRYLRDVAGSSAVPLLGLELDRLVVLRADSPFLEITSTITGDSSRVARVSSYSLDEVTTVPITATEVHAYHGGSDWRDDYRAVKTVAGAFDEEGEVARLDDGTGAGVFFVTERRGHVASRVGRDAQGRSWAGVDLPRDLFDFGPLRSDPPDYNRLDNPVYPVPVRARVLVPGQAIRLGRVFTGVYAGGAQEAAHAFAAGFARNVMPAFPRSIGLNTWHPWGRGPQLADANLRRQALLAKQLGVETFMLDDQWQGGAAGESGDWQFDEVRFPDKDKNGVPDFATFLRQHGMKLGLWASLANFNPDSQTYQAHPDWACAPTGVVSAQIDDEAGLGVWDINNPALRAHITAVVDRMVRRWGVAELKVDFQSWVDCGTHDYLDYEDGFLSLIRSLQARYPQVTFELDETNDQRAWPFASAAIGPSWFDNGHLHGSTKTAKQLHDLWSASPWLPTSTIGFGFLDGTLGAPYTAGYLAPMALLSHLTFWTDQAKLTEKDRTELSWWLRWYTAHRADLAGASYELTAADPIDGRSPMVLQPWTGDHGELFAFWQAQAKPLTVRPHGLNPKVVYRVADVRTGKVLTKAKGSVLARGMTLRPTESYSAQVLTIAPVR